MARWAAFLFFTHYPAERKARGLILSDVGANRGSNCGYRTLAIPYTLAGRRPRNPALAIYGFPIRKRHPEEAHDALWK